MVLTRYEKVSRHLRVVEVLGVPPLRAFVYAVVGHLMEFTIAISGTKQQEPMFRSLLGYL
ncbi:hypothetical protein L917_14425 [Phytophthora nicotianae]|uniref:Uncharacterized protein n=1 Tax=Phytophthora nicotianae TaxID=4792 RepID=W2KM69_PHYNI|nr:hypothetical protein L917_14425 [Phytophthora nicotianae]